jgi:hypothetical protein
VINTPEKIEKEAPFFQEGTLSIFIIGNLNQLHFLPAVKTGANSLIMGNNEDSSVKPVLPDEYDLTSATTEDDDISFDKNEDDNGDVATTTDDCATPDIMSVEMLSSSSVAYSSSSVSSEEETRSFEGDDDGDLLELLAETLDVDFDPNLLCFD